MERVPAGSLHWRLHPNGGRVAAVAVPLAEAPRLVERGWIRINGERAVVAERLVDETYNAALRIVFDRPYPESHP
ncbi:MAG: hypothetical protein ACRDRD_18255 [Pseudonocardiaceae bacterium]